MISQTLTVMTFRHPYAERLMALLLLLLLTPAAQAASTWDGGGEDSYWNTATNWLDDVVPTFPAALTFAGSTRLAPTNDLTAVTVTNITFSAGSDAFALRGNAITLGGNISVGAGGSMTNNQTIDMPLALSKNVTLTAAPVGGYYTGIKGALVINGAISGPFGLTATGKNYVQLNGTNTYSGDTVITGDNASFSIGNASAFGSGKLIVGATPGESQLWIQAAGNQTITNNVEIRTGRFISYSATVAGRNPGNLTLSGNVLLNQGASGADIWCSNPLTISGTVSGGAPYGLGLAYGTLILQGVNTFTNNVRSTDVNGSGRVLNINSDAALGHTNNSVLAAQSMTFQTASGTSFALAPSRTFTSYAGKTLAFDIPSASTLTVPGAVYNNGALTKSGSGALTLSGAVTNSGGIKVSAGTLLLTGQNTFRGGTTLSGGTLGVNSDASLGALPTAPTQDLFFAASSTLRAVTNHVLAANRTLAIGTNVAATLDPQGYTQTICSVISGAPGSWLVKDGAGTLALDPGADRTNSVWSLNTKAGTLQFLSGTHLVNSNTVWNQYKVYDILLINNGGTLLVGGGLLKTTGDGYATVQNGTLLVTNGTMNLCSLQELLNAYTGTGNTTVSGRGVLDLNVLRITQSGTPHNQNVVNVNTGGTIRLKNFNIDTGQVAPYGTVNLNGGTLVAKMSTDGFLGYNVGKWLTNVFVRVLAGGAVIDSDTNNIAIALSLYSGSANDGGLTKRGSGTLTLANTNTYTGVTAVEAGTLKLNVSNTLWAGGIAWVASNAVLDVNGKAQTLAALAGSGTVTNNSQLAVTVGVAPGSTNAIGTLTLAAAPAALAGTLLVDVAANGNCDRLKVQGDLTVTSLDLVVANPEALNKDRKYVIASYAGSLNGPFLSAPLPDRWHVKSDTAAREVYLSYDFGTRLLLQ